MTDPLHAAVCLLWWLLVASPLLPIAAFASRWAQTRRFSLHELFEFVTALAAAIFVATWTWTNLDLYRE